MFVPLVLVVVAVFVETLVPVLEPLLVVWVDAVPLVADVFVFVELVALVLPVSQLPVSPTAVLPVEQFPVMFGSVTALLPVAQLPVNDNPPIFVSTLSFTQAVVAILVSSELGGGRRSRSS